MTEYFAMLAERVLHDPNSPARNDELYIPVLEALVSSPWLDRWERIAPQHDLRMASQNRIGRPANDFRYTTADGVTRRMYDIRAEYLLLFINNPGCNMCKTVREAISASPMLNELIERGKLKVLALFPDEDLTEWQEYRPQIPARWINAYDKGCVVRDRELYDLKAIPALYLLDRPQGEALYAARNRSRAEQAVEGFEAGSSVNPLTPANEERIDPDDFRVTINAYKGYNIYVTNGVNYIVAKEGDTFESLAEIFCISARNLRKFNDLKGKAQPVRGEQIYIDRKQKRWEGNARHHIVTEGETVASVAQSYALREKSLRKLNRLKAGAALRTGQTLRIR